MIRFSDVPEMRQGSSDVNSQKNQKSVEFSIF